MSKLRRRHSCLLTALLLGVASCGDSGAAQTRVDEPILNVEVVDQAASGDRHTLVHQAVSTPSGPDLELSVSAGEPRDDLVVVTIKVRSLDTNEVDSPEVRLQLGDGVVLSAGNDACALVDGELRCLVADKIEDPMLPTASAALDIAFEVASEAIDPSVTFSAQTATSPETLDPDPSNNHVTVVFIRPESDQTIEIFPLPDPAAPRAEDELPQYTLEVHTDGCGVFRSGEIGDDLTWVVTDEDGFQVLGRNAAGETQYRYFTPGTYTVVLEAWGGDYYVAVSNEVTINC